VRDIANAARLQVLHGARARRACTPASTRRTRSVTVLCTSRVCPRPHPRAQHSATHVALDTHSPPTQCRVPNASMSIAIASRSRATRSPCPSRDPVRRPVRDRPAPPHASCAYLHTPRLAWARKKAAMAKGTPRGGGGVGAPPPGVSRASMPHTASTKARASDVAIRATFIHAHSTDVKHSETRVTLSR